MYVRTAGEWDVAAIRSLLAETWHATYDTIYGKDKVDALLADWHSAKAVGGRVTQPGSEFLVADDGKAIAGVAFATFDADTRKVALHQLYVRPPMQGHGVGGLLLDEIEAAFPEAETVRVEVEPANAKAVGFYVGQGFAKAGETSACGRPDSGIAADIYERAIVWAD
ncbi:MAG: GNAT family N-acetyltransferase [Rhizobiaceae bacterium]|nr:GNAT family N-acetyltransferase [Rhizobiaceae bacterium]